MSLESRSDAITHERFLALQPSYEEVMSVLSPELQHEYIGLSTQIKEMPNGYAGIGNRGIEGPLHASDQNIWDRHAEISLLGKEILTTQGWLPKDPGTKTTAKKIELRILTLLGNPPGDHGIFEN